jgi:hypothetical protein
LGREEEDNVKDNEEASRGTNTAVQFAKRHASTVVE